MQIQSLCSLGMQEKCYAYISINGLVDAKWYWLGGSLDRKLI